MGQDVGVMTLNNMVMNETPVLTIGNEACKRKLIDQRGINKLGECEIRVVDGADGLIHSISSAASMMEPCRR